VQAATRYIPWADLLKRVYDLDALACPKCGGRLEIISLTPVLARARAPTLFDDPPPADYDAA
jgi:hypothetical protein